MRYIINFLRWWFYAVTIIWMIPVFVVKHIFVAIMRCFRDWKKQAAVIKKWVYPERNAKE